MNFEKKMKKRGNQKLNKFAYNPYHKEPKAKSFPTWGKVLIPTFATVATVVVLFAVVVVPNMSAKGGANMMDASQGGNYIPAEEASYNKGNSNQGAASDQGEGAPQASKPASIPTWEERSIIEQYPEFTYDAYTYQVRYDGTTKVISATNTYVLLDNIIVNSRDTLTNVDHQINASVYSINHIARKCALAIKFEGSEDYYAYTNKYYYPATLSDLLADSCFEDEVIINKGKDFNALNGTGVDFVVSNDDSIMEIIYSDKSPTNIRSEESYYDDGTPSSSINPSSMAYALPRREVEYQVIFGRHYTHVVSFKLVINSLGISNAWAEAYDCGYMSFNLFGRGHFFDIGETRYSQIKAYIDTILSNN